MAASAVVPLAGAQPASAAGPQALGVHRGPGDAAGVDGWSTWLGRGVQYAVDFLDMSRGWDGIANPTWQLNTWGNWKQAAPGRRLSLGVPMLPSSEWGNLAAGANGAFDEHFWYLARNLVDAGLGDSVLRVGWEADNADKPWQARWNVEGYRAFYIRIVDTMRTVAGQNFTFDWTMNNAQGGSPIQTFGQLYPGDNWVDVIGLDQYDLMWQDSTSPPEVRWDFILNNTMGLQEHRDFARAHGKLVSFPEWGLRARGDDHGGGGDNPYYVDRMADWFASSNMLYQSYFDEDWGGGTLANFPNSSGRYRARFGS